MRKSFSSLVVGATLLLVGAAGAEERVKLDTNRVYDLRPPDAVQCGASGPTPVTIMFFGSPPAEQGQRCDGDVRNAKTGTRIGGGGTTHAGCTEAWCVLQGDERHV